MDLDRLVELLFMFVVIVSIFITFSATISHPYKAIKNGERVEENCFNRPLDIGYN
jgi:hypothetical protein